LDLRKPLKMSVSLTVAYAEKRFLRKQRNLNNTDNYQLTNYIIIKEIINNIIVWKFIWGVPPAIEELINSENIMHKSIHAGMDSLSYFVILSFD
jgi:hypothetical protein